ncbi:MAG: hypothetical protein AAF318_13595 [Pseudomonadota bacterium]
MANLINNVGPTHNLSFEVGRTQALTKEAVQFTQNAEGNARCGNCSHFIGETGASGTCQIVSGEINSTDTCAVFALKPVAV